MVVSLRRSRVGRSGGGWWRRCRGLAARAASTSPAYMAGHVPCAVARTPLPGRLRSVVTPLGKLTGICPVNSPSCVAGRRFLPERTACRRVGPSPDTLGRLTGPRRRATAGGAAWARWRTHLVVKQAHPARARRGAGTATTSQRARPLAPNRPPPGRRRTTPGAPQRQPTARPVGEEPRQERRAQPLERTNAPRPPTPRPTNPLFATTVPTPPRPTSPRDARGRSAQRRS
jgi:hypothetical protein